MATENIDTGSENTDTSDVAEQDDVTNVDEATTDEAQEGDDSVVESQDDEGGDGGANAVPEAYDFNVVEGIEIDTGLAEAVSPVLKDLNLNQDQAASLTKAFAEYQRDQNEASEAAFNDQLKSWGEELKSDKDFGGDNFDKNAGMVREFIQETIPSELKEGFDKLLNETGLGNHPTFVKVFYNLAKKFPVNEDAPSGGNPTGDARSREEKLYPNG